MPDLPLLQRQLAELLRIPYDVVAAITGWGPDDPRTAAEVDSLLAQRFGAGSRVDSLAAVPTPIQAATEPTPLDPVAGLLMSSNEFTALLHLTPEQAETLQMLVRQTRITISRD